MQKWKLHSQKKKKKGFHEGQGKRKKEYQLIWFEITSSLEVSRGNPPTLNNMNW